MTNNIYSDTVWVQLWQIYPMICT